MLALGRALAFLLLIALSPACDQDVSSPTAPRQPPPERPTGASVDVEEPELPRSEVAVQLLSVNRSIRVTDASELQAAFDDIRPGDEIVLLRDRVWVWAPGDAGSLAIRRGVRLNGEEVALINSREEGIIRSGYQSQGVGVWDGGGPFPIEINFIEAPNQNFLAGGRARALSRRTPSTG